MGGRRIGVRNEPLRAVMTRDWWNLIILRRRGRVGCLVLVALGCLAPIIEMEAQQERTVKQSEAETAVNQLWSDDEMVRLAAKGKLIELGPEATRPLMTLLEDLRQNPGPRYVRGKQKEGEEAFEQYRNLPNKQKVGEALKKSMSLEISGRLSNDVYELLGRLHAVQAVPLLVEIVEKQEIDSLIPGMTPAMRALAEIGPVAVPRLIESIENAASTAAFSPYVTAPDLSEEAKQRNLEWQRIRIQVNAVLVLENIGDARALPVFEKLLNTTRNEFLARMVGDAITALKQKKQ